MPTGVVRGIGLVVDVSAGAVGWALLSGVGSSQLAASAHPPIAVPIAVRFVVWVASRATTSQPRAWAATDADINRGGPLVRTSIGDQAPKLLLSSPTPDAMPLSRGHGICEAVVLDGTAVTDGQRLLLSLSRQLPRRTAMPRQLPRIKRKEDVVVR
jgi:hypothetical protein